jgi:hypothetical protein
VKHLGARRGVNNYADEVAGQFATFLAFEGTFSLSIDDENEAILRQGDGEYWPFRV